MTLNKFDQPVRERCRRRAVDAKETVSGSNTIREHTARNTRTRLRRFLQAINVPRDKVLKREVAHAIDGVASNAILRQAGRGRTHEVKFEM